MFQFAFIFTSDVGLLKLLEYVNYKLFNMLIFLCYIFNYIIFFQELSKKKKDYC